MEQLNKLNKKDLMLLVLSMQDQLTQMNDNLEKLIEQIRIANQQRFGRHTETLDAVSGQRSLFNEAEALSEDTMEELTIEEVLATIPKQKKQRGEYYSEAEPPVRCGESHLSGLTEPLHLLCY